MRIELQRVVTQQRKDELLAQRLDLLDNFISQTADYRVKNLLLFCKKHLHTGYKSRGRTRIEQEYQQSWIRAKNDETRKIATRSWRKWTACEDEVVLSAAIPDADIAKSLGRSLKAVECRRVVLRASMRSNVRAKPEPTAART